LADRLGWPQSDAQWLGPADHLPVELQKRCLMRSVGARLVRNQPPIPYISEPDMQKEPEPSGTDAVFVVVCLLIALIWFVSLMVDATQEMLREALARFMFHGWFSN
jgi:hypothetical protein